MSDFAKSFGPFRTLCWAIYLGCSWTWCIGMFLPVILVSEFGNIAWFVFAIPNVIGAEAMGWTLAKPLSSEKMVAEHRQACSAFSAVTIAFHLFFLYWMTSSGIIPISFTLAAISVGVIFGLTWRRSVRLDMIFAFVVLLISLTVLARGLAHPVIGVASPASNVSVGRAMTGLAPVCVFGFLLCPYLDLTFHRARQATPPTAGKIAFGIGFGVVFLSMICLTLLYAGDFSDRANSDDRFGSFARAALITWVALHIAGQIGFTLSAHLRALPRPKLIDLWIYIASAIMVALGIFAVHQQKYFDQQSSGFQMYTGTVVYWLFMSFYGLVFPAYVWLFIVPIRGRTLGRSPRSIAVWIASIAVAIPMFWMGFINGQMLWLLPGVTVLFASRLAVARPAREAANERPTSNVELPTSKRRSFDH